MSNPMVTIAGTGQSVGSSVVLEVPALVCEHGVGAASEGSWYGVVRRGDVVRRGRRAGRPVQKLLPADLGPLGQVAQAQGHADGLCSV
jgi:hypothetical protein